MKRLLCYVWLFGVCGLVGWAQTHVAVEQDSIRLSKSFLKELEAAFSFVPEAVPINPPSELTVEQLHQWVGTPDTVRRDTSRFTPEYFAYKVYLKEFCHPVPLKSAGIFIPGLTKAIRQGAAEGHTAVCTFDLNALADYVRPNLVRIRKARAVADKSRAIMDKFFPMSGAPLFSKQDSIDVRLSPASSR